MTSDTQDPVSPDPGEASAPAGLPPAVHELQRVLAPIWAAEPDAVRVQRACEAHRELRERAFAVHELVTPDGVAEEPWRAAVEMLWSCTEELGAYCGEEDPNARFIAADALACAHDAFQDILDLLSR